jgi:hypothetical protein
MGSSKKLTFFVLILLIISIILVLPLFKKRVKTITKIPYQINQPGHYKLKQDFFSTSDCLITIHANHVILDLNKQALSGTGDWNKVQSGICATDIKDLEIKNGRLNNFTYGIQIEDSTPQGAPQKTKQVKIHHLYLENNTFRGIKISGSHSIISNNVIRQTGGLRLFKTGFSLGIETYGSHFDILNNHIIDTFPVSTGEGVGICLSDHCNFCRVIGNTIENQERPTFGRTFGIWVGSSQLLRDIEISRNRFVNTVYGFNDLYDSETYAKNNIHLENNIFDRVSCTPNDQGYHPYKIKNPEVIRNNTFIGSEEPCSDTINYYRARFSENLPEV